MSRPKLMLRKKGKPRGKPSAIIPYQFKKGQPSPNPEGRRLQRPTLISEALKLGLKENATNNEQLSKAESIANALLNNSERGDNQATAIVLERTEGKSTQHVDLSATHSGKIQVEADASDVIKKLLRET